MARNQSEFIDLGCWSGGKGALWTKGHLTSIAAQQDARTRLPLVRSPLTRSNRQHHRPNHSRHDGACEHPDLHGILKLRRGREREEPDEQAHREPDPAQKRDTVDLSPGGILGTVRPVELDDGPSREKDPDLLAEE